MNGNKNPFPKRAVRDDRCKLILNLATELAAPSRQPRYAEPREGTKAGRKGGKKAGGKNP